MCCDWIEKPKLNDVYALFKHSNFCAKMLKMHSKRPRYQSFSRNSHLCLSFSFSTYSKAFAAYFGSYWKPRSSASVKHLMRTVYSSLFLCCIVQKGHFVSLTILYKSTYLQQIWFWKASFKCYATGLPNSKLLNKLNLTLAWQQHNVETKPCYCCVAQQALHNAWNSLYKPLAFVWVNTCTFWSWKWLLMKAEVIFFYAKTSK